MDLLKRVQGNAIRQMTKEEVNKELIAKGDWGIQYYVPGRRFYPFLLIVNKVKYRFDEYTEIESFCKKYPKKYLQTLTEAEISNLKWEHHVGR